MRSDVSSILFYIGAEFVIYRFFLIAIGHIFTRVFKKDRHFYHERELTVSCLLYVIFTFVYFRTLFNLIPSLHEAYMDVYLLMVVYSVFAVLWAYLSWDMDHWFRPVTFALNKDVIIKKGILYAVVLVGAFVFGFYQTKVYIGELSVNPLYSIANLSIFTIIIALDRVVNQVYLHYQNRNRI